MITPQTDIILLQSPLELTDINQITFASATAQYNYFSSLPHLALDGATYQRKDNTIRYPATYDDLLSYNYVMYRNEGYSNKWFYAFIDKMDYINDNLTAISIKEDVFQTWQFDFVYKAVFVEREHDSVDTVGHNVVPENFELGEYTVDASSKYEFNYQTSSFSVMFLVTELIGGIPAWTSSNGRYYNGIWSGLYNFSVAYGDATHVINAYTSGGKVDAIQSIYVVPTTMTAFFNSYTVTLDGASFPVRTPLVNKGTYLVDTHTFTRPTTINGYTPKNNKLFTYPYCFIYADNNSGQVASFNWEDFANTASAKFTEEGVVGQGCSMKLIPESYKNLSGEESYTYGISATKLPVCGWTTDYYTAYMVQNGLNVGLNLASAGVGMATGVGSSVSPLPLISGMEKVAGTLTEVYKASIAPDQAFGNTSNSDINVGHNRGITVYVKTIRAQMAAIIDDFFSMYGYAIKRVKTPNITGRTNWNYVKTINAYVGGDIPQDSLNEYKNMLDRGITFWHNPSTFMDYSQSNAIVTT